MSQPFPYVPRNDMVIVEEKIWEKVRALHMPQVSMEAKRFYVRAVGSKVEGLEVGDRVLMTGVENRDWSYIPGTKYIITRESNVVLKFTESDEKEIQNESLSDR